MKKITFEDVATAARRLSQSGDSPSAPKIRKLLNDRGGMATIQKHLDTWRESEEGQSSLITETSPMPEHLALDAQALMMQIWNIAKAQTASEIAAEREALTKERQEINMQLNETIEVSEKQEQQIEELNTTIAETKDGVVKSNAANIELASSIAVINERCTNFESQLKEAKAREENLMSQLNKLADRIKNTKSK